MPRNGSGTQVRVHDWTTDAGNAVKINATRMDEEFDDITTEISRSIARDGQTTVTADLPMATFKHTGVGASSARTHYARVAELQDGTHLYCGTSAGTNTVTAAASPVITAYVVGQRFYFKAGGTNTGAVTLNINSVGAGAVQKNGLALTANEIIANDIIEVVVTATTPVFEITSVQRAGDGSVGAPSIGFRGDTNNGLYRIGTDNWAASAAGAKVWEVSAAGEITTPLQPAVLAYNSAAESNVTGDGTSYAMDYDTEVYDVNGDFAANALTAPVTGKYLVTGGTNATGFDGTQTETSATIVTSNRTYQVFKDRDLINGQQIAFTFSVIVDMDAADTLTAAFVSSGGNKVVDIGGAASPLVTWIAITLLG